MLSWRKGIYQVHKDIYSLLVEQTYRTNIPLHLCLDNPILYAQSFTLDLKKINILSAFTSLSSKLMVSNNCRSYHAFSSMMPRESNNYLSE